MNKGLQYWALSVRRLRTGLLVMSSTLTLGTLGFWLFEDWTLFESFYVSLLVIATLGFGVLQPATVGGQLLTVTLIGAGVGTLYYLVGIVAELAIEGQLGMRQERRMQQQISRLSNHVIVCGYGRVGQEVVSELQREGQEFVVVETDNAKVNRLMERGVLVCEGDASDDDVLAKVNISKAKALIVCSGNDAINVFITLSARAINEHLLIVARAIHEEDEPKLLRAGAQRVITPALLGGRRLVSLVLRPTVVDWLDVLVQSNGLEMWLEELPLADLPHLHHRLVRDLDLRTTYGITILAIKRADVLLTVLDPSTRLEPDDIVVAVGSRAGFARFKGQSPA